VPTATEVWASGIVARTMPAGTTGSWTDASRRTASPSPVRVRIASDSRSPVTSGTRTSGRPVVTIGRMPEPGSATVPAPGSWATTVPSGRSSRRTWNASSNVNPASVAAVPAREIDRPTRLGTGAGPAAAEPPAPPMATPTTTATSTLAASTPRTRATSPSPLVPLTAWRPASGRMAAGSLAADAGVRPGSSPRPAITSSTLPRVPPVLSIRPPSP